jgi:hypothetical protein
VKIQNDATQQEADMLLLYFFAVIKGIIYVTGLNFGQKTGCPVKVFAIFPISSSIVLGYYFLKTSHDHYFNIPTSSLFVILYHFPFQAMYQQQLIVC